MGPRAARSAKIPGMTHRVSPPTGFSLLELLVVLALVSLVAALALPNLVGLYGSATRATERDLILDQFAGIGREAMLNGHGYAVYGTAASDSRDTSVQAYPLIVPEGWQVELDQPLWVRPNGVCLGATATLSHPDSAPVEVALEPPYCRVEDDA